MVTEFGAPVVCVAGGQTHTSTRGPDGRHQQPALYMYVEDRFKKMVSYPHPRTVLFFIGFRERETDGQTDRERDRE